MELKNKIFIIMPFAGRSPRNKKYWTNHFEQILKPCINTPDFPADRSSPLRKDVLREIISNLIFSRIVLADITSLNKNVMWELGVRQSFRNGTIVIAESGTKVPFDITTKSIIFYPKLSDSDYTNELIKFKNQLKKAVEDCKNNPDTPDSHILEIISGRGSIYEIISREETIRKIGALIDELEFNICLLPELDRNIEFNRVYMDNPQAGGVDLTLRFRTYSVELLLTTRYLIQNADFYESLLKYFDDLERLNSQIDSFPRDRRSTVGWFKMHRHEIGDFNCILSTIKTIHEGEKERIYL